jgi:adenylosuccinate synthase
LVIRAFPIRVAGASGELPREIDWETVTRESGSLVPLKENTSVTGRLRRVALFDADVVRRAIEVNAPSLVCVTHVDHVDAHARESWTRKAETFVTRLEETVQRTVDYVGTGPSTTLPRPAQAQAVAVA